MADRLSTRGGAYQHLIAILERQALMEEVEEVHLAVGSDDGTALSHPAVVIIPGLDSRTRREVAPQLEELRDELRPDVIHMHNLVNPSALDWASRHRILLTLQDHRFFCPGRGKLTRAGETCREAMSRELCDPCFDDPRYRDEIFELTRERRLAVEGVTLVVLSHYMKAELSAAGIAEDRIDVVPPFVHGLNPEAPPGGPPAVLHVGRLVEAKGVEDTIAAWKISGVSLPLVFAGSGPMRERLEREGFPVLGWLGREELSAQYRRAAAVVMPSRWQEPFGIVGLEALTMGVPVVAWDSGGVGEWHRGGRLVRWGDRHGLGRELARVVAEKRRGRAPEGFEPEPAMERLHRLYRARFASGL